MDCIILAGGRGRRLVPGKGMLPFGDTIILDHIMERHARFFSRIFLQVTDDEPYRHFGVPLIRDKYPGAGPLGAVLSGLSAHGGRAFFCACDKPFYPAVSDQGPWGPGLSTTMPWSLGSEVFASPSAPIYTQACVDALEKSIRKRDYKLSGIFRHVKVRYINIENPDARGLSFFNINTPADYLAGTDDERERESKG